MTTTPSRPQRVTTLAELRAITDRRRRHGQSVGLVPTMGALHEGHLSLVRASKAECDCTVVSIYVNPTQFGPEEDLGRYPRTLEADLDLLAGCGAEVAFVPGDAELYPPGFDTWVEVSSLSRRWEGECRPGHFRGVTTVVLKLLNMAGPQAAYFGQKDYQQALLIEQMVRDLNVPVSIRICPTVREADGLAMSSRNRYLDAASRSDALVLWKSLRLAAEQVGRGQRHCKIIADQMRALVLSVPGATIDYIALADPHTLEPVDEVRGTTLAALAVRLGGTRLIDNQLLEV
jgi:pantoate--beta-alanine ligase